MNNNRNQIENMNNKINLIYCGTPEISSSTLEMLVEDSRFKIVAVITQPDKPVGRKHILTSSAIKKSALKFNLPIFQPEKLNKDKKLLEDLKSLNPDFLIVFAYGQILSEEVLQIPRIKPINIHGSLLPKYRGASPIEEALLNNEKEIGISYMEMVKEMDAGSIYQSFKCIINCEDDGITLKHKLAKLAAETCAEMLIKIKTNKLKSISQNESEVSFCHKISKLDGLIDFRQNSTQEIMNKYRAFISWPGINFKIKNKNIKIHQLNLLKTNSIAPGHFQIIDQKIKVGTKDKDLEITQLQMEGKQIQTSKQFLNGYQHLLEEA